jgi:hypothetical protein
VPPLNKAGEDRFRKDVEFVTKDEAEQRAVGIVMVPDKADLQNDFAREATIQQFADQFGNFAEVGEAGGGVMHAAWPDEWMSLERNEVLDEAAEIGGATAPGGAWVQEWQFNDDELWSLVDDGILEGYSIGAVDVSWDGPYEQDADAVDGVAVADALGEDELIWELTDGIIREVSAVDIPAVPDAMILDTKADADKRLADHLGSRDDFVAEAQDRGHTEAEAERLWDVLNEAVDIEGAGDPGKNSMFARAGKAFLSALSPGEPPGSDDDATSEAPDQAAKEGRTLSTANRESLFATVDASLDVLQDAGVDELPKRFTDRDDVDFDLTEHRAREWGGGHGGGDGEDEDDDESVDNDAPGGETPDDSTDMTDDDGEDKSLAEQNAEQIDELTDAVKSLTEAVDGDSGADADADKTAEVELPDGSVAEVSKQEVESWFDEEGGADNTTEAAATKADIEAIHARLDAITRESAGSQQLEEGDEGEKDSGLDAIGGALS